MASRIPKFQYRQIGEPMAPVDLKLVEDHRRRFLEQQATDSTAVEYVSATVTPIKKVEVLSPVDLRKRILSEKNARQLVVPRAKSWEETKPCAENEYTTWRDPAFKSWVTGICRNSCIFVLECLEKDRALGAAEGIRAGMPQIQRQELYALQSKDETQTLLSDFAEATYVARALNKK